MSESSASDLKSIEAAVTDYFEGMIYGESEKLRRAMHPLCMQAGHFRGAYEFFPRDDFIASLPPDEVQKPGTAYKAGIVSIDLTGDVAVAKVTNECFGTSFTDYLTLIRHDGRWQIVMKAFYDHANG